jgi:vacuolar-type H+-ATPase subunit D/Vma8
MNTEIEFFKFLSDLKVRAQKDAENEFLSRECLNIALEYYSEIFYKYIKLHKDNHYIELELEELQKSINKLKHRINLPYEYKCS